MGEGEKEEEKGRRRRRRRRRRGKETREGAQEWREGEYFDTTIKW